MAVAFEKIEEALPDFAGFHIQLPSPAKAGEGEGERAINPVISSPAPSPLPSPSRERGNKIRANMLIPPAGIE
jgi:hypothetical protein